MLPSRRLYLQFLWASADEPPFSIPHEQDELTWNLISSIPPTNRSKVKSSAARALRQKLLDTYPGFEPYIEEIMPKKASLEAVKLYVDGLPSYPPPTPPFPLQQRPSLLHSPSCLDQSQHELPNHLKANLLL